MWDVNAPARALENTAFVAAVNRYGVEDQLVMPGHTKVCNPRGHVVAELAEEAEGVLHVARPERSGRLSPAQPLPARPSPRPLRSGAAPIKRSPTQDLASEDVAAKQEAPDVSRETSGASHC